MKAVILVAGKGTRMAKTYEGPKHLLPVNGKPIIEHFIDELPPIIDGLILVVGGPHEAALRQHFSAGHYNGLPVEFTVQKEQLGLAHAFWAAAGMTEGRWLGAIGDDLIEQEALEVLLAEETAILAHRTDHPENFGVLIADESGNLIRSVEKPKEFISDLVWTGHMVMDDDFFAAKVPPSARGEFETPDVWMKLMADYGKKIKVVEADFWLPINDHEQLLHAEQVLKERKHRS